MHCLTLYKNVACNYFSDDEKKLSLDQFMDMLYSKFDELGVRDIKVNT